MHPDEPSNRSLEEYRGFEAALHRDLMNCCRRYVNYLGIVSIVGIIDIVKQETIELEKATKKNIGSDQQENTNEAVPDCYQH